MGKKLGFEVTVFIGLPLVDFIRKKILCDQISQDKTGYCDMTPLNFCQIQHNTFCLSSIVMKSPI